MLSPDDHPGIFSFLVGIVVIVMTAVGLSMLVDQRFRFSSGVGQIRKETASSEVEIAELRSRLASRSATLADQQTGREPALLELPEARRNLANSKRRKEELLTSRDLLRESISTLESGFSKYRSSYRRMTWEKANGEKVGNLKIRGGREYLQATITKVTDVGLEISHEHGFARIHAPDLDAVWQERFQWSDEERRARLREESRNRESMTVVVAGEVPRKPEKTLAATVGIPKKPTVSKTDEAERANEVKLLRTQVIGWQSKVIQLGSDQREASSKAGYGNPKSVPGSLETWKARAARLDRELSRARIELTLARGKLAAISPGDPLLAPGAGGAPY